jgi:hypothetical protein
MAQIRIVDDWLRSPASPPIHYRSVMVIAEKWAEQRVLMRAYAASRDQTMPTITLNTYELAIGPAGTDINGPWGIHVGDPNDGRAQAVKGGLEEAARRLAGSKGNPPRLADEESTFEREPTANWAPSMPALARVVHPLGGAAPLPVVDFVLAVPATRVPQLQVATHLPPAPSAQPRSATSHAGGPSNPDLRRTPLPRRGAKTRPPPHAVRTALGYTSGSGAQSAIVRLGLAPQVSASLGRLVDRVVPSEFHIDAVERKALNALGEHDQLDARRIGQLLDVVDAVDFMENLLRKLEGFGLGDLVEPAAPDGSEPTYRLRR